MAREATARLLEIASTSVALKSEPVVGTTSCATTERSLLTSGTRTCRKEDAGTDVTRPSLLDLVKDLSRNIHSLKHTRETRYPVRPGEASYMQRLLHGMMRLNRRETHLATQNVGIYRARYSKELPGSEEVASRDGKHAKEGTLKPQVPRLSAVASWRLLRRRGSGRPG